MIPHSSARIHRRWGFFNRSHIRLRQGVFRFNTCLEIDIESPIAVPDHPECSRREIFGRARISGARSRLVDWA
ncbi:MAG TPA: hypothetical protein PKJ23_11870 [bacterium]|nr:hypothetical protein [bacterium]